MTLPLRPNRGGFLRPFGLGGSYGNSCWGTAQKECLGLILTPVLAKPKGLKKLHRSGFIYLLTDKGKAASDLDWQVYWQEKVDRERHAALDSYTTWWQRRLIDRQIIHNFAWGEE